MRRRRIFSILFITAVMITLSAALSLAWDDGSQTRLDPTTLTRYLDPLPDPAKVDGTASQTIAISEFTQQVLPSDFTAGPYGGKTLVWGYDNSYPGPTVEAVRGMPFQVTYENNLNDPALLPFLPIDQTLHWADPLGCKEDPACDTSQRYTGPVPVVVHLHGGEVPSAFDGHPDAWFTPGSQIVGPGWVTNTFTYPNEQEATTLWYHDHALGITRLNVYAGLAGFYLLRDPQNEPSDLPAGPYEREIVIQDRMFDTDGQLFYPDDGQDDHPFWVPKFLGDTIVVNGKTWPYLDVEPRRYRLRFLNGSNARIYDLRLEAADGYSGPDFWQIGTDGGLLNTPVEKSQITLAPAERVDVIVDFSGAGGTSFILKNSNDDGSWSSSDTVGEIMKFNVALPLSEPDTSLDPSTAPNLRPNNPIVDLGQTVTNSTATRYMTLDKDRDTGAFLLNDLEFTDPVTETPRVGSTEVWEIENNTRETHPIHVHLIQFQVLDGDSDSHHSDSSWDGDSDGSSSSVSSGWKDTIRVEGRRNVRVVTRWAPQDVPAGSVQPGENLFSFDPTATMGTIDSFGFPGGSGYVWHCHILEHEDNEMMRPLVVMP